MNQLIFNPDVMKKKPHANYRNLIEKHLLNVARKKRVKKLRTAYQSSNSARKKYRSCSQVFSYEIRSGVRPFIDSSIRPSFTFKPPIWLFLRAKSQWITSKGELLCGFTILLLILLTVKRCLAPTSPSHDHNQETYLQFHPLWRWKLTLFPRRVRYFWDSGFFGFFQFRVFVELRYFFALECKKTNALTTDETLFLRVRVFFCLSFCSKRVVSVLPRLSLTWAEMLRVTGSSKNFHLSHLFLPSSYNLGDRGRKILSVNSDSDFGETMSNLYTLPRQGER